LKRRHVGKKEETFGKKGRGKQSYLEVDVSIFSETIAAGLDLCYYQQPK